MKKLLSLILAIVMVIPLAACGGTAETEPAVVVSDGQTVGEGAHSFPLVIVDKEGNQIQITVCTDAQTVGEALAETGIVQGEYGEFGLYITHVNGIAAIYEEDATYWGFYIDDEYALTGVDETPITDGKTYMLKVES